MSTITKPAKPTPDFPFYAHSNGQWAKKIKGKLQYFGPWDDPHGALQRFLELDAKPVAEVQPSNVAKPARAAKTDKPRTPKGSPLYSHSNGQWAKRINGKIHYFGPWADHQAALEKWLDQKDDLLAGRDPQNRPKSGIDLDELVNRFQAFKLAGVQTGELSQVSYDDYERDGKRLLRFFGINKVVDHLSPSDFEKFRNHMAKTLGPVALGNAINRIRIIFKYGFDQGLMPVPMKYGQGFDRPSRKTLRKERRKHGKRMFQAQEIRDMLGIASREMKAMMLLGINCGFDNAACATLKRQYLDLEKGYHHYHREKTEVDRCCPLWPETVEALKDVLAHRRTPKDEQNADMVFITKYGDSWANHESTVTHECTKILNKLGIKRPRLNFRCLRHTFETIGEKARDKDCVSFIMGHAPRSDDMAAVYREEMDDERLRAVTDYVWKWLYCDDTKKAGADAPAIES